MPNLAQMQMPPLPPALAVSIFYREVAQVGLALVPLVAAALLAARRLRRPAAVPEARPERPPARELLASGLGVLWILDGLLQMQPLMVTRFLSGVVAPAMSGEPRPLAALMRAGVQIWGVDPISWNVVATYLQIGVGLAILCRDERVVRRAGLWASLAWGLVVWVLGEGMGGVFAGGSWLSGAPGSVLLYMLGAVLLLLPAEVWQRRAWQHYFARGLGALWLLGACLQAWPAAGFWSRKALAAYVASMAGMPQPAVVAAPLLAWARAIQAAPAAWNACLVVIMAALACAWLLRPGSRSLWGLTAAWTLLTWYFGQDFGVLGGMGTDPNSGAVLTVLLAAYARSVATAPSGVPAPPSPAPAGAEGGAVG